MLTEFQNTVGTGSIALLLGTAYNISISIRNRTTLRKAASTVQDVKAQTNGALDARIDKRVTEILHRELPGLVAGTLRDVLNEPLDKNGLRP